MQKSKKPFYGERTKKKIVEDYFKTSASMDELAKLHGVLGSSTVGEWLKKYGNLSTKKGTKSKTMKKPPSPIEEKNKRSKRYKSYEHLYICELESDLISAKQKVEFYRYAVDLLNEVAKEALGIDLLKKTGEQLSSRSKKRKS